MHVGIKISEAAGRKSFHLGLVKLVPHPNFEFSGNHRYVFAMRMPVWRNLVAPRHFKPDRELAAGRAWISFQHRQLRAGSDKRWWRTIFDLFWSEGIGMCP